MPTSARHRVTPAGPRSTTTPSASSTSAVPTDDDAARLPCLHTVAPAPAAMQAAMVDTLILRSRSPPVPTTSSRSPSTTTGSPWASMARTNPLISSIDSPLTRRATTNAAIWASEAEPSST